MLKEEKTQKIKELNRKLSALKEERDKLNAEAEKWMKKRNKLNERVKTLSLGVRELRKERDELNEKVRKLKQLREKAKVEVLEKIEEFKKLRQEIRVLTVKKPSRTLQTLQREVEKIEWKIQINPLDLKEEKKLIERVKNLEDQLSIHKKIKRLNEKAFKLQAEIKALKTRSKIYHEELMVKAEESQKIHERMLVKIEKRGKVKTEADEMHLNFLKIREKTKAVNDKITAILNQIKVLRREIRREEEEEGKKREEALRKKVEEHAREKLRRGEKLAWEEFKIISEKHVRKQD